jgi:hypothetical protein
MTLSQVIYLMLLIIFIGILVLVGIQIYKHQAFVSNQKSLEIEMNHYSAQVFVYWKTPLLGGGAGQNMALVKKKTLADFVGFAHVIDLKRKGEYYSIFTNNGEIRLIHVSSNLVVLQGIGKVSNRGVYPKIQSSINLYTFMINTSVSSAKGF